MTASCPTSIKPAAAPKPKNSGTAEMEQTVRRESWILIRGLLREQRHWGAFPQRLAQALSTEVICLDTPGNGELYEQSSANAIAPVVTALREQLKAICPAEPIRINLLGISMGAMICTEWARQFPDEIKHMVFINTSFANFSPFYRRLKLRNYVTLLKILTATPEIKEKRILELTSQFHQHNDALIKQWQTYAKQCPIRRSNALRQFCAASRYRAPEQPPIQPVLLLASKQDQLVDARCSSRIAERWQVPIRYHPEAGHDLPLDDSDWIITELQAWLVGRTLPSAQQN